MHHDPTPAHRSVALFGAALGAGANDPGCAEGPDAIFNSGIVAELAHPHGHRPHWKETFRDRAPNSIDKLTRVAETCRALATGVRDAVAAGDFPVVIGGEHTCAIGTWAGVTDALDARGKFGLIWIDAHMDAHTPDTTESGNLHGMPLAVLLGLGEKSLVEIAGPSPHLDPRHVCLVGVRSFEKGEAATLKRLGVRVFHMDEIHERGLAEVLTQALEIASTGTAGFGVSLDLDVIDPDEAPGVGLRTPDGLHGPTLLRGLKKLRTHPAMRAFEMVEFNPDRDEEGRTLDFARAALRIVAGPMHAEETHAAAIALEKKYGAHNYAPPPLTLVRGRGVYVWDEDGRRYLDMMSAYSAVSHGHAHPRLLAELSRQSRTLAVTSRAFYTDRLSLFLEKVCLMTGMDRALPMNTGAEAVETALKAARKWAYKVKGVAPECAEIIACHRNFHGRTIAVIGLSTEPQYRDGFGAFPGGLKTIPYGDPAALEAAITPNTAAFLVEPIQGEGGILVPPPGYLAKCAEICRRHNVLLLVDEIQTGLGRTGKILCCDHDGVKPDGLMLGKALGGGLLPVSAFLAREDVMAVFTPGDHGSTFGGNPLAAAVALEALKVLEEENLAGRASELGPYFMEKLRALKSPLVTDIRGRGLLIGVEVDTKRVKAKDLCAKLRHLGLLTKETHETVLRFAPPLTISKAQLDRAAELVGEALKI
jgi:ornithine--oxo-acid transaminase